MTIRTRTRTPGGLSIAACGCLAACLALEASPAHAQTQEPTTAASPQDQRRIADLLLGEGRFREAAVEYRQWLRGHPRDAAAHNRLGLCLQKTGRAKEARREYERATQADRCYAEAWNNLGTLDHVRANYKRAVAAYRKAIECKPGTARFYTNLGAAYMHMGDLVHSTQAYAEALRLDPKVLDTATGLEVGATTSPEQYFNLARACARQGELEAALKFLLRARDAGFRDFNRVSSDPAFAELVADPRYAELIRR